MTVGGAVGVILPASELDISYVVWASGVVSMTKFNRSITIVVLAASKQALEENAVALGMYVVLLNGSPSSHRKRSL